MSFMTALVALDPALGRLDYDAVSQQTQIEIAFADIAVKLEDMDTKDCYFDANGNLRDLAEVTGLYLDSSGDVKRVEFMVWQPVNKICFEWLPATVTYISISRYLDSSPIAFDKMPRELRTFHLRSAHASGTVDMAVLPPHLRSFTIKNSAFISVCNINKMPLTMGTFAVSSIPCTDSIDFSSLPKFLECFSFEIAKYSGAADLTSLPRGLVSFSTAVLGQLYSIQCVLQTRVPFEAST